MDNRDEVRDFLASRRAQGDAGAGRAARVRLETAGCRGCARRGRDARRGSRRLLRASGARATWPARPTRCSRPSPGRCSSTRRSVRTWSTSPARRRSRPARPAGVPTPAVPAERARDARRHDRRAGGRPQRPPRHPRRRTPSGARCTRRCSGTPVAPPTTPGSRSSTPPHATSGSTGTWPPTTPSASCGRRRAGPARPGLHDLVGELSTRSEAFRTRWAAHDVHRTATGAKQINHPVVGRLDLMYDLLPIAAGTRPVDARLHRRHRGPRPPTRLQVLAPAGRRPLRPAPPLKRNRHAHTNARTGTRGLGHRPRRHGHVA